MCGGDRPSDWLGFENDINFHVLFMRGMRVSLSVSSGKVPASRDHLSLMALRSH